MDTTISTRTSQPASIPFWRRLRWNLIVYSIVLVVLPILTISIVTLTQWRQQAVNQSTQQLESVAQLKENQIRFWLTDANSSLDVVATGLNIAGVIGNLATGPIEGDEEAFLQSQNFSSTILASILPAQPLFEEFFVYNLDGQVIAASDEVSVGKVVTNQPYFANSLLNDYIQAPYFQLGTNTLTMVITQPIRNENGETVLVLAGRLNIGILSQIMTERTGLSETTETFLVSRENNYLLTPSIFEGYPQNRAYQSEGISQALIERNGSGIYDSYRPGISVIGVYRWIPEISAGLLAETEISDALTSYNTTSSIAVFATLMAVIVGAAVAFLYATRLSRPINQLANDANRIAGGDLDHRSIVRQSNEIGLLSEAFNSMTKQLQDLISGLEARVLERTDDLSASIEVGQLAAGVLTESEMLPRVVNFIRDRFNLYYTQVYLIDEAGRYAVLRAGTGEVGEQLLARNHRLELSQTSLVATAVQTGRSVLVENTQTSAIHRPNPLLPATRSELSVPLIAAGQTIGVLDMQSDEPFTFNTDNVSVFEAMASQIAASLRGAQAYDAALESAARADLVSQRLTADSWGTYLGRLGTGGKIGYRYDLETPTPLDEEISLDMDEGVNRIVTPIELRGQNIGTIVVGEDHEREWKPEEKSLVQDVAARVVQTLEQMRAFDETQKRAREMETVSRVSAEAATNLDIASLLQDVSNLTKSSFDLYHAHIYLLDDTGETLQLAAGAGETGNHMVSSGHKIPVTRAESLVAQAARTRQGVVVNDVTKNPNFLPNPLLPDTRSEMAIPMIAGNQVIGVLDVQADVTNRFTAEDVRIQTTLADQIAVAVQNARLFGQTEQALAGTAEQARRLSLLNELSNELAPAKTSAEVFDIAAIKMTEILLDDRTSVALATADKSGLELHALQGEGGAVPLGVVIPMDNSYIGRVYREQRADIAEDFETLSYVDTQMLMKQGLRSAISAPLVVDGEAIGTINVASKEPYRFTEAEFGVMLQLTAVISSKLENIRAFDRAQQALQHSESLYEGSDRVSRAVSLSEVLLAVIESTALRRLERGNIILFNEAWRDEQPDYGSVSAVWEHDGRQPRAPIGTTYTITEFPFLQLMERDEPFIVYDSANDDRLDSNFLQLLAHLGMVSVVFYPLVVGEDWLGLLTAQSEQPLELNENELRQINSLVDQASAVIQSIRLFEETQLALGHTEALYAGSNRVGRASNYGEVLDALVISTSLITLDRASMVLFDSAWEDERPQTATIIAAWESTAEESLTPPGTVYNLADFPMSAELDRDEPMVSMNVETDERVDENTRELFRQLGMTSFGFFPVVAGGRWIGLLTAQSAAPLEMSEDDIRRISALTDQAANIVQNIRLYEETQEALQEIDRIFSSTLDMLGSANFEGYFTNLNPAWETLLGYTRAELMAQPFVTYVHPDDVEKTNAEAGKIAEGAETISFENRYRCKDGSYKWISWNASPDMEAGLIHFVARDVSDQKRAEDEIRRRARELETVARVSAEAATNLDLQALLTDVSNLTKGSFDLYHAHIYLVDSSGEYLRLAAGAGEAGHIMVEKGHSIPINSEISLVAQAARSRKAIIVNDVTANPNFLANPLLPETQAEMAIPMIVGGQVIGVLDTQSDERNHFTDEDVRVKTVLADQIAVAVQNARAFERERETVEQLREVDRLKQQFLANMSHELRTPLNSIIGYSEVLLDGVDGDLNEDAAEDVEAIHSSGKHLLSLINEILDLAKIDSGQMQLAHEAIPLPEFLHEIVRSGQILVKDKPVEMLLVEDDKVEAVNADLVRLRQIMWNLVSNAVKFTEEGSVTIRYGLHNDSLAYISVADTGIGMNEDDLSVIFERFSQVDGSSTRRAGGTGLGLTITRELILMHGGDISVESEYGAGSTFVFTMPIYVPEKV